MNGIVLDSETKHVVPFASVRISNTRQGTNADLNGKFSMIVNSYPITINVSCVGYKTRSILFQDNKSPIEVELKIVSGELNEITVRKGINPALPIIKKASKNRKRNNPDRFLAYSYQSYNKVFASLDSNASLYRQMKERKKIFENREIFVSESVVQHKYKRPNQRQEKIIAFKTSGVQNPLLASLLTDFQSFGFYMDWFVSSITDKSYLSPLAPNGNTKYDFELLDTLVNGTDSTYIISFRPKPSVNIPLLTGFVHINTNKYAIENIVATSNDNDRDINIQIQQQYQILDSIGWFPERSNTIISFRDSTNRLSGLKYVHKSLFSQLNIDPSFKVSDFNPVNREIASSAATLSDSILSVSRIDSLSVMESNTYDFYESKHNKLKGVESMYTIIETALLGYVPLSKINLPLKDFINYNKFEGLRLGLGFQTNDGISKMIRIGGYIGYGIKDQAWKYGGDLQFNFGKDLNRNLQLNYEQNVEEPGTIPYMDQNRNRYSYREFWGSRMDSVRRISLIFSSFIRSNLLYNFCLTNEVRNPIYDYQLTSNDIRVSPANLKNTEISGLIRYRTGEKKMNLGKGVFITGKPTTDGYIRIARGIKSFNAMFDYIKINVGFESRFQTKLLGETSYQLAAGYIAGKAPYSYLYNGESAGGVRKWGYINNSFNTMNLYEFVSDKYFSAFIRQNLGQRFFRSPFKISSPEISFSQGVYFGFLSHQNQFSQPEYKVAKKGYLESGMITDKLLRLRYLKIVYIDFGIGLFLRYGSYSKDELSENLSFRLLTSASF
ncbi:DUF5686 and carboxypeptidase-like regulatory domain-containing protein [Dyadobacter frigoris]|uniref:DUF5686 and carboxypeptidase-like regulatory domain-containing protein n=1 Tax=Dyadobacter frigoris TaxID=2576211 RepID=UPI001485B599|nr:DUF5686 and carboxypeptidase-like regulatory domain-containing protein [Dyadobacter frigoris]GLU56385.1 hypothetical protein Dfri01_58460 [Dyadobacter frigoris]